MNPVHVVGGGITLEDREYEALVKCVQYLLESEETSFEESNRSRGHVYRYALLLDYALRTN